MLHPVLLFVPLDDRPVTSDVVVELARSAGVDVRLPDRALLGDRFRPGAVEALWEWLEAETRAGDAAGLIASVEMLCFGGLVASRKSNADFEEITSLLDRLLDAASRVPAYVSSLIPRTPVVPTDEDAPYWASYGDALHSVTASDVMATGEAQQPSALPGAAETALQAANVPQEVRTVIRRQRGRHLRINTALITAAGRGLLRYLIIGQDDTFPGSLSEVERSALAAQLDLSGASNVLLTSGADELNARLLARWLNDRVGRRPSVRTIYTFPWRTDAVPLYEARALSVTVAEHIASTGCVSVEDDPDIVLWVHNFEERQREAVDQGDERSVLDAVGPVVRTVRSAVREERVVALADVRFANGGDRELVGRLLEEPRFAGIVAYAGWNTSSNAVGSVLAQAVIVHHLRANRMAGNDRRYRPALFQRLLDDWGYQAVVRPSIRSWLEQRGGAGDLEGHEAEAEHLALGRLREEALPRLQRSFAYHPVTVQQVAFPWHRLFEVRIDLDIVPAGRSRPGMIVTDYDPRWPQMYEEDRAAILHELGLIVRGIEHVGSTSVPGLAAKSIIDILLGVSADDLDRIIEPLVRIGYEYNPDWEISMPLRRYFRRIGPGGEHTHHLHAVPFGGEFWTRHLRFRDYLRAHPDTAKEYGELKKRLAQEHRGSIDYTFAKTDFIQSVEALAGVRRR